jgi:hypothetical protein
VWAAGVLARVSVSERSRHALHEGFRRRRFASPKARPRLSLVLYPLLRVTHPLLRVTALTDARKAGIDKSARPIGQGAWEVDIAIETGSWARWLLALRVHQLLAARPTTGPPHRRCCSTAATGPP